ncbi:hypothetical protein BH10CYA1_BH10CYA1_47390 [soil metagenome]
MFGFKTEQDLQRLRPTRVHRPNRRVDAVIAPLAAASVGKILLSRNLNKEVFFAGLSANKSTCCLRISNPLLKSRATIILLRGRVLSCVYGQRGQDHLFGEQAFGQAQSDLLSEQSLFSVNPLVEQTALASAAFFEGSHIDQIDHENVTKFFSRCCELVTSGNLPACFVLFDDARQVHSIIYLFGQKIVASYSSQHGWINENRFANHVISKSKGLSASCFILEAGTTGAVYKTTFSLTGLTDNVADKVNWLKPWTESHKPQPLNLQIEIPYLKDARRTNTYLNHQAALAEIGCYALRHVAAHSHCIDPGIDRAV